MRTRLLTLVLFLSFAPAARAQQDGSLDAQIASAVAAAEAKAVRRDRVAAEIEGLVAERSAAQDRLRARVRALYRLRRAGMLPLAGGFDALLRHQSRVERLERIASRDLGALRSLRARLAALQEENARLAGEAEQAEREVSALRERRAALERATMGMWAALGQPAPVLGSAADAPWSAGFGLRVPDAEPASFAALRGRIPLPVGGSATLADAQREGGAGLELSAAQGTGVRSVGAGRVAYAAPHPAYGRLVILDHGDGYYTVYGGLGVLAVQVGQSLTADAPLGSIGGQPLFFQVRRGTRPLPAREWLGI